MKRTVSLAACGVALLVALPALVAGAPPREDGLQGYRVLQARCFSCHGAGVRLSGLDLRTRAAALKGGKQGAALLPGRPEESRLFRHVAGLAQPQMPPPGPLPADEVTALREWIGAGAPYPGRATGGEAWWSFRPVRRPSVPASGSTNPIDAFVDSRLKRAGIRPNPPADRRTLLRRVTFDMHGLPPTPEEVAAFEKDRRPGAWARVVERLLASPRYGERWARHWLDLARYAESEGFKSDETRPNAWRYRDYVIRAFNEDRPYDRFVREQIAGDEMYPGDPEALVATGFNRHWPDESNARNIRLRRQEILNDVTDTVGSVFMGLTVGCARCHDHKYDPVPHRDYYRLQAFLSASHARDDLPLVAEAELAEHRRRQAAWEQEVAPIQSALDAMEAPHRRRLQMQKRMPFPAEVQEAIDAAPGERTALQWHLYLKVLPQIEVPDEDVGKELKGDEKARWEALRRQMEGAAGRRPEPLPMGSGFVDAAPNAPPVHVLGNGVYDAPGEKVEPGFLTALTEQQPEIRPALGGKSSGRRTALAEWLASPGHPLTARVMVNRVWQGHFGKGLVGTASDFGRSGERPTHPELLDWLAAAFSSGDWGSLPRSRAWSLKALHRAILLSRAYQRAAAHSETASAVDSQNRLLWRFERRRLTGEEVRDACLAVSGELNPKMGGPSIFPELPAGVSTRGGWKVTTDPVERARRSIYVFVRRNMRYPLFESFDYPDTHEPCARRSQTNTAPQALMLLNSTLVVGHARAMAARVMGARGDDAGRLDLAFRLALGRPPDAEERPRCLAFLREASEGSTPDRKAWTDLCHVLMNANEFLFVE